MRYRKLGNKKSQMSAIGLDVGSVLLSPPGKREIMKKYILGIWMVCLASLGMAQTPKAEQVMNKKQQYIVEIAALVGKGCLLYTSTNERRGGIIECHSGCIS